MIKFTGNFDKITEQTKKFENEFKQNIMEVAAQELYSYTKENFELSGFKTDEGNVDPWKKRKDKMGVKDLLEVLSAHAAGHTASAARHAARSAGLGGDDIIDSQNHDGGLGCRVDGLGFNPERLDYS